MEYDLTGETRSIKAVQHDLARYFQSLNISHRSLNFSGKSWRDAVEMFRSFWDKNCICNRCHNITSAENAKGLDHKCRKCRKGKYVSNPREMWRIILKHDPMRTRYFTVDDFFSMLNMNTLEFQKKHSNGFLIKTQKQIQDNSVIRNFKTIFKETIQLKKKIPNNYMLTNSSGKSIVEIRKKLTSTDPTKIMIGRYSKNDIVFHNKDISRFHAYLLGKSSDSKYFIIDNKSTNGTFLNKEKIKPHQPYELRSGYEITFGPKTRVVYFSSSAFYKFFNVFVQTIKTHLE